MNENSQNNDNLPKKELFCPLRGFPCRIDCAFFNNETWNCSVFDISESLNAIHTVLTLIRAEK